MAFGILSFTGCTHNNGDIGPWFGQWKVERIDKDGQPDPEYQGNCLLRFQSSVVTAVLVTDNGYTTSSSVKYGNWEESGGYMHFEFKEYSNAPLEALHFDTVCSLKVLDREGKNKRLQLAKDDGTVYTYYLVKW